MHLKVCLARVGGLDDALQWRLQSNYFVEVLTSQQRQTDSSASLADSPTPPQSTLRKPTEATASTVIVSPAPSEESTVTVLPPYDSWEAMMGQLTEAVATAQAEASREEAEALAKDKEMTAEQFAQYKADLEKLVADEEAHGSKAPLPENGGWW